MSIGVEVWKFIIDGYKVPSSPLTNQYRRNDYVSKEKIMKSILSGLSDS